MLQVVLGTGGRCHVQHAIHGTFHRKLVGDILLAKREARLRRQMRQIAIESDDPAVALEAVLRLPLFK